MHERLRAYTYLYPPERGRHVHDVYTDPMLPPNGPPTMSRQGFTALKFDPAGPLCDLRSAPAEPGGARTLGASALACARPSGPAATCSSAPMASSRLPARSGSPGGSSPSTRSGSRSRRRPKRRRRWRWSPARPASRSPPASASPRSMNSPACWRLRAAAILQPNLGRVGGLLEGKKIAGMAEAHYAQIAPHLYCGPVDGAANIQFAACSPNFLVLESIERLGRLSRRAAEAPAPLGGRPCVPPTRRASASSSMRRSRWPIPRPGRTCISSRSPATSTRRAPTGANP